MPPRSNLSDTHAAPGPAGWHGKLPCLGDFATRRLPSSFVSVWDTWLSTALQESRRRMGDRWLDAYLSAPLWRFVASPGLFGDGAWAGLLMSSVDRVGRHFPLTIARGVARPPADADGLHALLRGLEGEARASLATLMEGRPLEAFEADLMRCALDSEHAAARDALPDPLRTACSRVAAEAVETGSVVPRGGMVWVEYGDVPTELRSLVLRGLPSPDDYCSLLSG